jgi:hypothetical protein
MPHTIKSIYELLFSGQKVTVALADKREAESLRVRLAKHHVEIVAVNLSGDSLCMDWNAAESKASYWLGPRRNLVRKFFEVQCEPVSGTLETDPLIRQADQSNLPEAPAENIDPSNSQEKDTRECSAEDDWATWLRKID